ncbi:hypothetical protein ACHAWF_001808 [Thalassiosira exigua]
MASASPPPTSSPPLPPPSPAADVLSLLRRYVALRSPGDVALRASALRLAEARRGRSYQSPGAGGYRPDDVREELRASAVLERAGDGGGGDGGDDGGDGGEEEEPRLVGESEEGDVGEDATNDNDDGGGFALHLDGGEELRRKQQRQERAKESFKSPALAAGSADKESEGLRRRRGRADENEEDASKRGEWTVEAPPATSATSDEEAREEAKLRSADPLCLFGVPPPALRRAQAEARRALARYVEAANAARAILEVAGGGEGNGP